MEQQLNYPVTLINVEDLPEVALKNYDVLIIPDGNYSFLTDKELSGNIKSWIKQGGKLIALQNAVQQMSTSDWGIKTKKKEEEKAEEKPPTYDDLKKYGNRDRESLVNNIPGAIFRIELDNSHPLAFGYPDYYYVMKQDGSIYEFMKMTGMLGCSKKITRYPVLLEVR